MKSKLIKLLQEAGFIVYHEYPQGRLPNEFIIVSLISRSDSGDLLVQDTWELFASVRISGLAGKEADQKLQAFCSEVESKVRSQMAKSPDFGKFTIDYWDFDFPIHNSTKIGVLTVSTISQGE